jgi:cytidylate kinase
MNVNLVFSGKLGCGKTTVSKLVALRIGARWNSFGSIVKRIASERGLPTGRETLQALGADLVSNSPEAFCRKVISEAEPSSGHGLVVDGLRHITILKQIQQLLLPAPVIPIYVGVNEAVRIDRIKRRGGINIQDLQRLESHSTEIEVMDDLLKSARLLVDNTKTPENTVEQILNWLKANHIPD